MINGYQDFYKHWRNNPTRSEEFLRKFPYQLSLGMDSDGRSLLPFHSKMTSEGKIVVTKSYDNMRLRLLCLRQEDEGSNKGAVITGQPGSGASPCPDPQPVPQLTGPPVLQEKQPS